MVVIAASSLLIVVGLRLRWQVLIAPTTICLVAVAIGQLAPYAVGAPRWLTLGTVGVALIATGARYEQRLRDARSVRAWLVGWREVGMRHSRVMHRQRSRIMVNMASKRLLGVRLAPALAACGSAGSRGGHHQSGGATQSLATAATRFSVPPAMEPCLQPSSDDVLRLERFSDTVVQATIAKPAKPQTNPSGAPAS